MKYRNKALLGAVAAGTLFYGANAMAQVSPTQVTQTATRLDAASVIAQSNTTSLTTNSQVTATAAAVAGQFFYLTGIAADYCQDATGAASLGVNYTTTNLPATMFFPFGVASAVSTCTNVVKEFYATPVKSLAAGTATTCVSPTAVSHGIFECRMYGYYAP